MQWAFRQHGKLKLFGNINWSKEDRVGLLFIYKTISSSNYFPFEILEELKCDINKLLKFKRPCTDNAVYDRIERRIVEYFWINGDLEMK